MIIRGRVFEQSKEGLVPVEGADVVISGMWRTLPEVVSKKASSPDLIHLHPPLYHDRKTSTPCQLGELNPVMRDRKILLNQALRGTKRLHLSNAAKLKTKDVVRIDGNRPEWTEILAVVSIETPASTKLPSWVTIGWPLIWDHPAEAMVECLKPKWSGATHAVSLEGHKGESCVFVDSTKEFVTDAYVKIGDGSGGVPAEYHRLALFSTKSTKGGMYQFPLLQRVVRLTMTAQKSGNKSKEQTWQPDYSLPVNQVDIVLKSS